MNSSILPSIWRFLGLVAVQSLLLHQITTLAGPYFFVLLYPLFIFFLPLRMPTPYLVLLGFLVGLAVDFAHPSIGVHASAGAFSGFMRPMVLGYAEPKGGFSGKEPIFSPAYFGWTTFLGASGAFFALHIFWYYSVDAFTFVYVGAITLKTAASLALTMIFVIFYGFLFNPKN